MVQNLRKTGVAICILIPLFFLNCAPSAKIPVLKPAEINIGSNKTIAIAEMEGNAGRAFSDLLTSRFVDDGHFEVVDRQHVERIMSEHRFNMSGAVDEDSSAKLGEMSGAGVLLFGKTDVRYSEVKTKGDPWKDKSGAWKQSHNIDGASKANTSFRVVDLASGKIIASKVLTEEADTRVWEYNAWPPGIDRDILHSEALSKNVDRVVKLISPHTVYVSVKFASSDIPQSKSGIAFAKQGLWEDALQQFKSATDSNPTDPAAWFNLGIACEYTNDFEGALSALKKSNQLEPSDKCVKEMANVNKLKADYKRLQAQGVN